MICFENVTKQYPSTNGREEVLALAGIDFRIGEGEFVCVLGPSGCGKTTLLNLLAGFVVPTSGRVLFRGEPVTGPSPDRAVVFQEPTLFPWLTVRGNVQFGLKCGGAPAAARREKVESTLAMVGLSRSGDAQVHELSGGMRQRVALARVLVLDPPALLMDEPFGALDANARERLQDELLRLWQAHRRTVVFVTHSVEEAAYLADRVVLVGAPPDSFGGEMHLDLPRPRPRSSENLRAAADELRGHLNRMPCCLQRAPTEET